jgi:hypothetical protein
LSSELTHIGIIYSRWSLWFEKLGLPLRTDQTPSERADLFGKAIPGASPLGWSIAKALQDERFGGKEVEESELREIWRETRLVLWTTWLKKKIGLKV